MIDTTAEAARAQAHVLRHLAPERRLEIAVDMSLTVRALLRGRLGMEHPDWPESRMRRELLRLSLSDTVAPNIPG